MAKLTNHAGTGREGSRFSPGGTLVSDPENAFPGPTHPTRRNPRCRSSSQNKSRQPVGRFTLQIEIGARLRDGRFDSCPNSS